MEARGTKTIFMPPLRCRTLSSVWRSSAALRPPLASASLKREAITATITATCAHVPIVTSACDEGCRYTARLRCLDADRTPDVTAVLQYPTGASSCSGMQEAVSKAYAEAGDVPGLS